MSSEPLCSHMAGSEWDLCAGPEAPLIVLWVCALWQRLLCYCTMPVRLAAGWEGGPSVPPCVPLCATSGFHELKSNFNITIFLGKSDPFGQWISTGHSVQQHCECKGYVCLLSFCSYWLLRTRLEIQKGHKGHGLKSPAPEDPVWKQVFLQTQ